jgi:hypothetical protein
MRETPIYDEVKAALNFDPQSRVDRVASVPAKRKTGKK